MLASPPPRAGCAAIKSIEHVSEFTVPCPMKICSEVGDACERFRDLADDVELMERTHRSEDNDLRRTVFEVVENVRRGTHACLRSGPAFEMLLPSKWW